MKIKSLFQKIKNKIKNIFGKNKKMSQKKIESNYKYRVDTPETCSINENIIKRETCNINENTTKTKTCSINENITKKVVEEKEQVDKDFINDLEQRILNARKSADEKKKINGIACDEPVQVLKLFDIKEYTELLQRINRAEERAKVERAKRLKQIEDDRKNAEERAIKIQKIKAKKELEQKEAEERAAKIKKIMDEKKKLKQQENIENVQESEIKIVRINPEFEVASKSINQKKNEDKITNKGRKLPWYATVPVAGALGIAALSGGIAASSKGADSSNNQNLDNNKCNEEIDVKSEEEQNYFSIGDKTFVTDEIKEMGTSIYENASNCANNTYNNISRDEEKAPVIVNIGDKINVAEGVSYTADCYGGGNSYKIGDVSWRPAAEYCVDKVAFFCNDNYLGMMEAGDKDIKKNVSKYAAKCGVDESKIDTSVLLSLVQGNGDTGWAKMSIADIEKNVSKNNVNEIHRHNDSISRAYVKVDFERE